MFVKFGEEKYKVKEPSLEMILALNPENELETFLITQLFLENIITKLLELNSVDYVTIFEKNGERLQRKLSKCEFSSKIDCLKSKKIIDSNEHRILKEICDLRNCYAHNLLYEVKEERIISIMNYGKASKIFFNMKEINEYKSEYEESKTYYSLIDLLYTLMISVCINFNDKLKVYDQEYDFGYILEEKMQ